MQQLSPTGRNAACLGGVLLVMCCLASLGVFTLKTAPVLDGFRSLHTASIASGPAASDESEAADNDGRQALQEQARLLEQGLDRLRRSAGYACTLRMQERVNGNLQPEDELQMSVRHDPFSVSLKWPDGTQRVVYVEGANDGKLLVSFGGWKRILGRMKLDPRSERAMSRARYPITEAGLWKLSERLLEYRKRDLGLDQGVACTMRSGEMVDGRDCYCFVVEYESPEVEPVYRRSIIHIDKALSLPISVENFTWGNKPGQEPLIERYVYRDLDFDSGVAETEFAIELPRSAG
jgi:hypothetical protein